MLKTLFEKVKLPRPDEIYKHYPHQLSGGQKQRVMIAMAIACKPQLLIADEPTTALDVTIQKEIIQLLKDLQQETEMSILFISHDLALVSEICQRVLVMYQGEIVEQGTVKAVFEKPKDPYTKALIRSKPSQTRRLKKLPSVIDFIENTVDKSVYTKKERSAFHQKIYAKKPFLEIRNLKKEFVGNKTWWFQKNSVVKAINDISFELYEGETLGLVGESGCGKSTLGRTLVHLEKATSGQIFYQEKDITQLSEREKKSIRKDIQMIFQDPFSSLNPRLMVGEAILEPMKVHQLYSNNSERKLQLIDRYETTKRNVYGGAIGYMDFHGNFNHAIIIRSFLSKNHQLHYQAGAGIVANSVPESELQEVYNKLGALDKALTLAEEV